MNRKRVKNNRSCIKCCKEFYTKKSQIERGRGKYCSKKCLYEIRMNRVDKSCLVCSKLFTIKKSRDAKTNVKTCSKACMGINKTKLKPIKRGIPSGERHWNWQGGKTKHADSVRSSSEYKKWRKNVFERDNYTCLWCKKRGGKLNADHIKPFMLYPDLVFDIHNGRTLCESCHRGTDTYGFKLYHLMKKNVKKYYKEI